MNNSSDNITTGFLYNNGDRVKDRITGFNGIVTSRLDSLNGCNRYAITPEALDGGKMLKAYFLDENVLELVKSNVHSTQQLVAVASTIGSDDAVPAHSSGINGGQTRRIPNDNWDGNAQQQPVGAGRGHGS